MAKFKAGDVVQYKGKKGYELRGEKRLTIVGVVAGDNYSYTYDSKGIWNINIEAADEEGGDYEFKLAGESSSSAKKEESMKKGGKSWTFNTIAPAIDIDFHTIAADLSKAHPIATVAIDGEEGPQDYVVILKSLLTKADVCDLPFELYTGLIEEDVALNAETFVVYWTERSEYRRIINFAKIVKEARYPDEYKNKGKVTVSVVKV